uniref:Uncharacterized protein n=1 Tax=Parascaris equorum TaxID=6256 RepID=A0A914RFX1_PAREQ
MNSIFSSGVASPRQLTRERSGAYDPSSRGMYGAESGPLIEGAKMVNAKYRTGLPYESTDDDERALHAFKESSDDFRIVALAPRGRGRVPIHVWLPITVLVWDDYNLCHAPYPESQNHCVSTMELFSTNLKQTLSNALLLVQLAL